MADLAEALFRIDPTQGLVDYVNTVKPYHTKVLDVLVEYVYEEKINVNVGERWKWDMTFTRPYSEIVYSCGYGYRWDAFGLMAPETVPTSLIVNATGKLFLDVGVTTGSSEISILRNISGHELSVADPLYFETDGLPPSPLVPGQTYFVTTITPTSLEVSDTVGGTPIIFTETSTLLIAPQGLPYNTFVIEPALDTSSYVCVATNTTANQMAFADNYDITGVDSNAEQWRFRVGTWTPGSGYTPGTYPGLTLTGGPVSGTNATATIVVNSSGNVSEVYITNTGTKEYSISDVLTVNPLDLPGGTGFTFTVTVPALTLPLTAGQKIYVQGNSSSLANGEYTVDIVEGSVVTVNENIPPLTSATGSLYTVDTFEQIPYWPTGTKVTVASSGNLPAPLVDGVEYYFVPTDTIGIFNLATKRFPLAFEDYVDLTSFGNTHFTIERAEPFSPGDSVTVFGSYMHHNDGKYIVSTVEPEGANFRVGVYQSVPFTTPNPAPSANDGAMRLDLGTYDLPAFCPPVRAPDLYAGTFIHEHLQFTFSIEARDYVRAESTENDPGGWGFDLFGTSVSSYGGGESLTPYTTITDGVSSLSHTHTILPTGYDTQLFDVGPMDETLWTTRHLQNLP